MDARPGILIGGLAAFQKFGFSNADTSKASYLQCLTSFPVPFSARFEAWRSYHKAFRKTIKTQPCW